MRGGIRTGTNLAEVLGWVPSALKAPDMDHFEVLTTLLVFHVNFCQWLSPSDITADHKTPRDL